MPGKWDFGLGGEYVDFDGGVGGVWGREVQEDDLGEVKFGGYSLFLGLSEGG